MASPTWSLERMRTTIQEEMFLMVSISKLKRAKAIVMQKALDATKGQYQLLYRYRLELLRSNPGSTVIVKKSFSWNHQYSRECIFAWMHVKRIHGRV